MKTITFALFFLSLTVSAAETPFSNIYCESHLKRGGFSSTIEKIQTGADARLSKQLSENETQFGPKAEKSFSRVLKDFFTNHKAEKQLKVQIELSKSYKKLCIDAKAADKELQNFISQFHFVNPGVEQQTKTWLIRKLRTQVTRLEGMTEPNADAMSSCSDGIQNIRETMKLFSKTGTEREEVWADFVQSRVEREQNTIDKLVERWTGREISSTYGNYLFQTAKELNTPLKTAAKRFAEIDDLGEKLREGIKDPYVASLTRSSLKYGKDAKSTVDLFIEIAKLGEKTLEDFSIHDREVAVLTDLAMELNLSGKKVVDRFYEIVQYAQNNQKMGIEDFTHISDQGAIVLTELSLRQNKDVPSLMKKFSDAYKLGHATKEDFYVNDLGTALLVVTGAKTGKEITELNKTFHEFYDVFEKGTDEELARLVDIAYALNLSAKKVSSLSKQVSQLAGRSIPAGELKRALALAHAKAKILGKPEIDADLIYSVVAEHRYGAIEAADLLIDEENLEKMKRSNSSSSNYSSSSSDIGGLSMYLDPSDGVKVGMSLGNGLGIDLSDGSLTINTGGITIDTDGSGIGFNL